MNKVPEFLRDNLLKQYGENLANTIMQNYPIKRPVTLRINNLKATIDEIKNELGKNQIIYKEVLWYKDALILESVTEDEIRKLQIYNDGKIYLQSLSSMIPVLFLNPNKNENILDMAAAPGGKTTQIASLTNGDALITACEKNKIRYDRLKYNVEKQGVKKITILKEDARNLDEYFSFDKILLDAPCSGSGTIIMLNENIDSYFNETLLNKSIKTQNELLNKAIKILKPGHEMIYSTCSILKQENEFQIDKLIKQNLIEVVPIDDDILNDIPKLPVTIKGTICLCPNELYEGFFIAKLRKK